MACAVVGAGVESPWNMVDVHGGESGGECYLRTREVAGSNTKAHIRGPGLGLPELAFTVRLTPLPGEYLG